MSVFSLKQYIHIEPWIIIALIALEYQFFMAPLTCPNFTVEKMKAAAQGQASIAHVSAAGGIAGGIADAVLHSYSRLI